MQSKRSAYIIWVFATLQILACSPSTTENSTHWSPDMVTVQLKWHHQAQFAGFYVARAMKYYRNEDLVVRFLEGGQGIDLAQTIIDGEAQFGIMSPEDVLIKRAKGAQLTAIAAIYRRSAVVYAAMADSGIVRPTDFQGKTLAIKGTGGGIRDFEFQLYAMMEKLDLDLSRVKLVTFDPTYTDFYNGTVAVTAAYLTGGVIKMRQRGYAVNLIWPGDYGVHFYSDILVTSDQMITQEPELVERFLRATLKGWTAAIGAPESAVLETLRYARIKDQRLHAAMLDRLVPLVHTGEDRIGWMKGEDWQQMHDVLFHQGLIRALPDVQKVFTTRFLEKIYGGQRR